MSAASDATTHIRERALTGAATDFGAPVEAEAWLAGMDIAMRDVAVTLICGWDGTTSLLMSTGGGIVGAGAHDGVQHAAHAFLAEAGAWVDEMLPLPDTSLPEVGRVRFFVRRADRCVVLEASEDELAQGRHDLAGLYELAQAVVTQVRRSAR